MAKRKYPIDRQEPCCNCGKICTVHVRDYEEWRTPQYCNAECKRERFAAVLRGEREPLTPRTVLEQKARTQRAIKANGVKPKKKERGAAKLAAIKPFTEYETRLWNGN